MEHEDVSAWLRLTLTKGVGNASARRLLSAFGLPQAVFAQPASALRQLLTPAQVAALQEEPSDFAAQLSRTLQWLGQVGPGIARPRMICLADADYPVSLLAIEDPPLVLYALGPHGATLRSATPAIAIVGSRNPTPQGAINARQFAKAFAQTGVCVVSGLALGIDGAAHQGALDGAAPGSLATIAVVGTGLDRVYPRQHHGLAQAIAERGFLLSEYPLGTSPLAANFPKRNRLIAGLAQGTLVVEAALQSGSLITARLAAEQGKDVFAIPGSVHSAQARGCHALIKQGAKLVESVADVFEELNLQGWAPSTTGNTAAMQADPASTPGTALHAVQEALGFDPVSIDALVARTGLGAADLQALLFELELAGQAARLPGGLYQRVASA